MKRDFFSGHMSWTWIDWCWKKVHIPRPGSYSGGMSLSEEWGHIRGLFRVHRFTAKTMNEALATSIMLGTFSRETLRHDIVSS